MILQLVTIFAILAADVPSGSPAPPTPLKEIGRIQALPVCTVVVVHANSAISDALTNDQDLSIVINRLRTSDLDGANQMQWHQRTGDLYDLAARVRAASGAGESEVKRLRALAAASPDATRKIELKAFADALGGALYRQKRVAVDLDKALAIIDGRRATAEAVELRAGSPQFTSTLKPRVGPGLDGASMDKIFPRRDSINDALKGMADEFTARAKLILSDEGVAADHTLGATTGC